MSQTEQALARLIERWNSHYSCENQDFPRVEHDAQWPSVCEFSDDIKDGQIAWQPVKNKEPGDFSNIEHALNMPLHEDIKTYYTQYWAGELALKHDKGPAFLLQLWNDDDFANLQENMIGHVLMKRRLRQKVTLFFGLTDEEELLLSLMNDTGEIWLESVGKEPHLKLADSMAEFIDMLEVAQTP